MTSFYLAGRFSRRGEFASYAEELRALGHTVTSSWLTGEDSEIDADWRAHPHLAATWARTDLADIERAERLVLFTEQEPTPRGGRHVEFGYGLGAWGPLHLLVGEPENIFHLLVPERQRFATWADLLDAVRHHRDSDAWGYEAWEYAS